MGCLPHRGFQQIQAVSFVPQLQLQPHTVVAGRFSIAIIVHSVRSGTNLNARAPLASNIGEAEG